VRTRCHLVGCEPLNGPYCIYCRTDLYDDGFIQYGWLEPLFRAWWRARSWLKKLGPRRCDNCGKKFRHGYNEWICSAECFDDWLPF
jgi:hypothetical protein